MTTVEFSYDNYLSTRKMLLDIITKRLTDDDKKFLLSFEMGNPIWELFPPTILKDLPAIKWKLINIQKLIKSNPEKHQQMIEYLKSVLE